MFISMSTAGEMNEPFACEIETKRGNPQFQ